MEYKDMQPIGLVRLMLTDGVITQDQAAKYFPELAESKDENIKKEIIAILKYKYELYPKDPKYQNAPQWIAWLEKQGEQKPVEKVEPKFKAGDWILHCGTEHTYQVVGIKDNQYQLNCGGIYTKQKIADVERCARAWDITKDAKDGDVLVSPLLGDDKGGVQIFMFKCLKNRAYADTCVEFYSRLYLGVFYNNEEDYFMGTTKSPVYPATKEQRDLLFQKMHEAGYEWDADKKELKKIEPKSTAWSDEDEAMIDYLLQLIKNSHKEPCTKGLIAFGAEAWLKSIKDRVQPQPKQEWSEEDGDIRDNIIRDLKRLSGDLVSPNQTYQKEIQWLKSLKPQNAWKPGEEQLRALREASVKDFDIDRDSPLYKLYQQLKAL